jgi:hypothetical protein
MQTDELIHSLTQDMRPVSRHAVGQRLLTGLIAGTALTTLILLIFKGFRPDLEQAIHSFSFWMKAIYTASLAGLAIAMILRVARPDARDASLLWLMGVPVAIILWLAVEELRTTPQSGWLPMWRGESWQQCSMNVFALSLPVLIGLAWAFRAFAPTHLRRAGAIAGLAAGAVGATVYGLHCPEVSATFVATWYTLGIALATGLGALLGPRLMRW